MLFGSARQALHVSEPSRKLAVGDEQHVNRQRHGLTH
jgi:hypothetical protein